jgi:hypothetical protein
VTEDNYIISCLLFFVVSHLFPLLSVFCWCRKVKVKNCHISTESEVLVCFRKGSEPAELVTATDSPSGVAACLAGTQIGQIDVALYGSNICRHIDL